MSSSTFFFFNSPSLLSTPNRTNNHYMFKLLETNILPSYFFCSHTKGQTFWRTPKLLDGLNFESKGEDNERRKSWGALLGSQHFGGRGAC